MVVKIVTDSTSDLPSQLAQDLGITIVPAYVHFGDQTYRDGVDISGDELYRRLVDGPVYPTTSASSPGDFAEAYRRLLQETDSIVSIVVTAKLSAMYSSALLGKETLPGKCRVEVVDSKSLTMGLGLIAMAAAQKARDGGTIEEVLEVTLQAVSTTHMLACLDTLKYALKGGRLAKVSGLLGAMGSVIKVKPVITLQDGDLVPAGVVRTRVSALERLHEFVKKRLPVEEVAVVHNTTPQEADSLASRIKSLIPGKPSLISRLGPGLGVHAGPGALLVALRKRWEETDKPAHEERKRLRLSLPSLRAHRP